MQCHPWREHARRSAARRPENGNDHQALSSHMDNSDHSNGTPAISRGYTSVSGGAGNVSNLPHETLDNTISLHLLFFCSIILFFAALS